MLLKVTKLIFAGSISTPGSNALRRLQTFRKFSNLQVYEFDLEKFTPINIYLKAVQYKFGFGPGVLHLNHAFLTYVKSIKPDIIWIEKGLHLTSRTLLKIKDEVSCKLVHYNPDDPFGKYNRGWRIFLKSIPYYDFHFVPRKQNISEYKSIGASHVYEYDRSFDPSIHRPVILNNQDLNKYKTSVGFIGSYARDRADMIRYLIQNGIKVSIYGNMWQRYPYFKDLKPYFRSTGLYGDDYTKAICGMDIALHFLRHENRDFQDSRTFEIPACGTFMLAERSYKHEELFMEDEEAVFFNNKEELLLKVKSFLGNSEKRQEIAKKGYLRCLKSGYDHYSRLKELFKKLPIDKVQEPC